MNDEYLSTLALLKTSYDRHGATYLDYVTPFVGDTIRSTGTRAIKPKDLRDAIVKRYGIEIPEGVLNTLTRRLVKRGFGRRSSGHFIPDQAKLTQSYNFEDQRVECHGAINDLVASFITFVDSATGRILSESEATAVLIKYADRNGLPILSRAHEETPLPISLSLDEMQYLTSLFVIQAFERDLPEKDTIVMLAKGSKLASVLYFPDPKDVTRRVIGVTALFDTPTLLSALGYQGTDKESPAREILDLAYRSRIDVGVFDHTLDEMREVLRHAGRQARSGGYYQRMIRGVEAHFLEVGYTASEIELLIDNLEKDLRSLRVRSKRKPAFRLELSVNESELEDRLQEEVRYRRRGALVHDLEALTAVFRRRNGRRPTKFENCGAVFVTPNTSLALVSRRFFQREYGSHWPIAITEDEFATLLWLKKPLAAPDLPERRVVADAYAALEPGFICWDTFLSEIQKLRDSDSLSEDDYVLLRYATATKDALMMETLGDPSAIDADTVLRIRERVVQAIRTPFQDQVDQLTAELAAVKEQAIEKQRSLSDHVAAITGQRDVAKRTLEGMKETQRQAATRKASRWGARWRWTVNIAAALVVLLGLWSYAPDEWELPSLPDFVVLPWLAPAGIFIYLVAKVVDTVFDWEIGSFGRLLELWVSKRLERRYLIRAGLDEPSADAS